MKKEVQQYITSLGGQSSYSGNCKTMFIKDPIMNGSKQSIEECVLNKFGFSLPFKLSTNGKADQTPDY